MIIQQQKLFRNISAEGRHDGGYYCKVCNYESVKKYNVTVHIETHIEGMSYSCSVCHKTFRSRNSLNNHKSIYNK